MKKVIRDERNYPIGFSDTPLKKGSFGEFCDGAGYTFQGYVSETMQSLDVPDRETVNAYGELF